MENTLKKIYYWIILLCNSLISILCVLVFNKRKVSHKIDYYSNQKHSNKISILANGPSVKDILENHLDLLKNTDLLVMNFFANTTFFYDLKPNYYILLDPAFFIEKHGVSTEINSKGVNDLKIKLKYNLNKVDWDMILFVPYSKNTKRNINKIINNPNIKIVFYHSTRILGFTCINNFLFKHNQGLPTSKNVIIPSLMLMLNFNYKELFMYGAEFSWTKTMDIDKSTGMMYFNDKHYYNKNDIRYFKKGGYKWWLESIVDMLNGIEQVEKYAKHLGAIIINRTQGSFIDSFKYENVDFLK